MLSAEEHWIRWWCAPWEWAHADWIGVFAHHCGVTREDGTELLGTRHDVFLHSVGVVPSQPPPPVDSMMQWLQLGDAQQQQALSLAGRICFGQGGQASADHAGHVHEPWCRAVAKALRPGLWLDASVSDARVLLAAWAGEPCWSRLRLSWAPDVLPTACAELPENKLQTLWYSVLWRVTTP
ncbi:type III secretion protein [Pseudomonas sp. W5-36]|uniref:type III secretion protein n=1 Tax=Pseudomonas sp. W5-36 TaxID=3097455 RepID=UPI00397AC428